MQSYRSMQEAMQKDHSNPSFADTSGKRVSVLMQQATPKPVQKKAIEGRNFDFRETKANSAKGSYKKDQSSTGR